MSRDGSEGAGGARRLTKGRGETREEGVRPTGRKTSDVQHPGVPEAWTRDGPFRDPKTSDKECEGPSETRKGRSPPWWGWTRVDTGTREDEVGHSRCGAGED